MYFCVKFSNFRKVNHQFSSKPEHDATFLSSKVIASIGLKTKLHFTKTRLLSWWTEWNNRIASDW